MVVGRRMDTSGEILVASPESEMRRSVVAILRRLGVDAVCASTVKESAEVMATRNIGLIFCDRHFVDGNYRDLVALAGSGLGEGRTRVVLTANFIGPGEYQEAIHSGVFDVIASPNRTLAVEWTVFLATQEALARGDHDLTTQPAGTVPFPKAAAASKM
jgi:DNA-binding NtrC family response regulator